MADLVLTGVDDGVLHHLQERAQAHGRTPAEEARAILTDALRGTPSGPWSAVDAIYGRLAASGRTFSDSADLLREDRDR
jgi:plasmid stability protein